MKLFQMLVIAAGLFMLNAGADAATITGKINFTKKAPKAKKIRMSADPFCKKANAANPKMKERVIVNPNKTLKNVFVYIKKGAPKAKPPTTPVTFDQKGCIYEPHVVGIQVGQPFKIINSDATLHNVHSLPKKNKKWNMGMASAGQVIMKKFSKPETMIKVKCDVHGWMVAYVGVVNHPYFGVSDATGTFTLKDVPPGDYTIEAWHEKYKKKTATVKVAAAGETKTVDFSY